MSFDIVASTGRTATTFMAAVLDRLEGVAATHEGYRGSDKDTVSLLPLVNLENAAAYASSSTANQTVSKLRNASVIAEAQRKSGASHIIDVAYYNAMIGPEILAQHPKARMIGIVRDCEEFVRSATTLKGEDPLPVGWPEPDKPLTDREKFIAMGRIRPGRGSVDKENWPNWDAIRRNIWLWQETNLRLCHAQKKFGDRVMLLRFSLFQATPQDFWSVCARFLSLSLDADMDLSVPEKMANKKPSGYQVGSAANWSPENRAALEQTQSLIDETIKYAL